MFSYLDFIAHRGLFLQNNKAYDAKPDILKFFWPGTLEQFADDAQLEVIEVIDGMSELQGRSEILQNGEVAPERFRPGQSIIAMRRN